MNYLAEVERKYVTALEDIQKLSAEVVQLRALIIEMQAVPLIPVQLGLTKQEREVLGALMASPGVRTKEQILSAAYSDRCATGYEPELKIIDVFVCKLRKKLSRFGIKIETKWGDGYLLPHESREALRRMNEQSVNEQIDSHRRSRAVNGPK